MKEVDIQFALNMLESLIEEANKWEEVIIRSKSWNAILIGEEEFCNLKEHIHLSKLPDIIHKIHWRHSLKFSHHKDIKSLKDELDN